MNDLEFDYLRDLLHKRSGLALSRDKRYLVESRLGQLCRVNGLGSLSSLVQTLRKGDEKLTLSVVEAMTTNETLFFRDTSPFSQFRDQLLPQVMAARKAERHVRIWCAAASSGQEPYSLAMILDEKAAELSGWRIEIIATDISEEMLAKARAGLYTQFEVQRGLPVQLLLKHFTKVHDRWQISPKLKGMISYKLHNLVTPRENFGPFDIIFCRNVLIYFDLPTKTTVLRYLHQQLRPDGALSLGSAETVIGISNLFTPDADMRGFYRPQGPGGMLSKTGDKLAAPAERLPARRPALGLVAGRAL